MADLIQRIEAAKEPSVGLFLEAFNVLCPDPCRINKAAATGELAVKVASYLGKRSRFTAMLAAQAWTSAAEMLVPDGWRWEIMNFYVDVEYTRSVCPQTGKADEAFSISDGAFAVLERPDIDPDDNDSWPWNGDWLGIRHTHCGKSAHPSLALLAAILRAERKDDE